MAIVKKFKVIDNSFPKHYFAIGSIVDLQTDVDPTICYCRGEVIEPHPCAGSYEVQCIGYRDLAEITVVIPEPRYEDCILWD